MEFMYLFIYFSRYIYSGLFHSILIKNDLICYYNQKWKFMIVIAYMAAASLNGIKMIDKS